MLYCLSLLLAREDLSEERRERLACYADQTASFLMNHSRLENGNCVFITDREGNHKLSDGVYDASIYADCFVIIGMAEYARFTGREDALAFAYDLYLHSKARFQKGEYLTAPYPEPEGYRTHG